MRRRETTSDEEIDSLLSQIKARLDRMPTWFDWILANALLLVSFAGLLLLVLLLVGCGGHSPTTGTSPLRYNYHEDRYEAADSREQLKYDYIEGEYEYADPDASLRYNYHEDTYEWSD